MAELIYTDKLDASIKPVFIARVRSIADYLGIQPNWLMQVMYSESRLNHRAVNPFNGASGLIQFTRSTAKGLGTTVEKIRLMNPLQQLELVKQYYSWKRGQMKSYFDVYAVTFFPALMGKPDDWVLQAKNLSAAIIAKQNPAVNRDKDAKITVREFKEYVRSTVKPEYRPMVFFNPLTMAFLVVAGVALYTIL